VLDPFFGAGTVALVAQQHGRDWLGIELNRDFVVLAEERIAAAREGVMKSTNERRCA
jgi:DNA modification methylase